MNIHIATLRKRRFLVFIESLEAPPSQAELFARIIDEAQVVAAMQESNRRVRIERILWRFQERVELKPLPAAECETITIRWLDRQPLRFSSSATERRFLRHVVQDSGGVPASVRGMLEAAAKEQEITPAKARGFTHEVGVRYLDMTPTLIVVFVVAMAARYIARGIHDNELYIVSGVLFALAIGLRYLVFRFR